MFKRDYSWIQDYIDNALNCGRLLTAGAFQTLKKELEDRDETIRSLKVELSRFKPRKRKADR